MFDVQLFRQYLWHSCMMEIQVFFMFRSRQILLNRRMLWIIR